MALNDKEKVASENILADKWDLALSNAMVKTGIGLGVGIGISVILFKRRVWPIAFGAGFGMGVGYSQGDSLFRPLTFKSSINPNPSQS